MIATKRCRILLYTLTVANVMITYAVTHYTVPPYTAIALLAIVPADLLLRAPLKYSAATACSTVYKRGEGNTAEKNRIIRSRKAIMLQLWLWKTRLWRYAVAFIPVACLRILSDRVYVLALPYDSQVVSAVTVVISYIILILGIALVELCMFRYMAVWYLLPLCESAKQAVRLAKTLSQYRLEEIAELCLRTLPFSAVRASWVSHQLNRSKHAYNFFENAKTVNGTFGGASV